MHSSRLILSQLFQLARKAWLTNAPLTALVGFSLICLLLSAFGLAFDPRLINGEHAWVKPFKFSVSLAWYGTTLIWIAQFLPAHKRLINYVSKTALVGAIIELVAIITQVLRGAPSHFNAATTFDACVWVAIQFAIVPVSLAIFFMFALLMRQKDLPPVLGLALRLGTFLTIVGIIPGCLMVLPDRAQDLIAGFRQFEGHTVGFHNGGPGLPFLGWSTVAGDLRVAHFVGLHALQIIPAIGFLVSRDFAKLSIIRQRSLVWNTALTYLGVILLLTMQALNGESLVQPSKITVSAFSILYLTSAWWLMLTLLPVPRKFSKAQAITSRATP